MSKNPTYFISTPIYFASGNLHIGHTYTTVVCDALARYKRMRGFDVFYLTGSDEHGQKVETNAKAAGKTPKQFVDDIVEKIKKLWELMDISHDKYIRTTDEYHVKSVQEIFSRLYKKGDIYKSKYVGKYCKPCESFWTESQLVGGCCPDCGRAVESAEEESYFFRLSKYAEPLRKLLTSGTFLEPSSRVNEMVNNFIDKGLQDLAVSRSSFKWGIPVPFDSGHVIYVWLDALSNYITALGYGSEDESLYKKYWPGDIHMVGKEIVRFHTIIWPAMLMALGEPVPKKVFGHGWIKIDGGKMSKSVGNIVDPFVLAARYGVDALRYYLLSEMPFGSDGDYTSELLLKRINSDLVNDLGNLVKRTLAMNRQYFGGEVSFAGGCEGEPDGGLIAMINGLDAAVADNMDKLTVDKAIGAIFTLIRRANKYIDETMPWSLAKDGSKKARLSRVIYNLLEAIRVACLSLLPFFREGTNKALDALGVKVPALFGKSLSYGAVKSYKTTECDAIYPRLDIEKELKELAALTAAAAEKKEEKKETGAVSEITIDDFAKCRMVVAQVVKCEKVEGADKLLKSTLDVGSETREVVSGIAKFYTPEEMVGKRVILLENLKPRKIRGVESKGMLLCACEGEGDSERLVLLTPEKAVATGTEIG